MNTFFLSVSFPPFESNKYPTTLFWIQGKGRHLSSAATCYRQVQSIIATHTSTSLLQVAHSGFSPTFQHHTATAIPALHSTKSWQWLSVQRICFPNTQSQPCKANSTSHLKPSQRVFVSFHTVIALALRPTLSFGMPSLPCDGYTPSKKDHNTPPPISGCKKRKAFVCSGNVQKVGSSQLPHTHPLRYCRWHIQAFLPPFSTARQLQSLYSIPQSFVPFHSVIALALSPTRFLWYAFFFAILSPF